MSVDGRSGIAGAADVDKVAFCGFVTSLPVDMPVDDGIAVQRESVCASIERRAEDDKPGIATAVPPLSHGFGGDTDAILPIFVSSHLRQSTESPQNLLSLSTLMIFVFVGM